jgi:hypothetical protein
MDVCINVPDDVVTQMQAKWSNLPRTALEALAIEAYRTGVITEAEVQRMLDLPSRWDTDRFLKTSNAYIEYSETDLERDIDAIRKSRS